MMLEKTPNEKLCDLYYSPNIIQVNTSRRIIWMMLVAPMGKKKIYTVKPLSIVPVTVVGPHVLSALFGPEISPI
jgi:hypothetical protein